MRSADLFTNPPGRSYTPQAYRERDSAFIDASRWPHTLIQLALGRGQAEHKLLRRTGIFCEDIGRKPLALTPEQIFRLFDNAFHPPQGHELAFLLGREWFEAQLTEFNSCHNLQMLLDQLVAQCHTYSPLLGMHLRYENERLVIYWQDNFGAGPLLPLLVTMGACALHSLSRWRAGQNVAWTFYFAQPTPHYLEQYQVHLGERLVFAAPTNAVSIARSELHRPWQPIAEVGASACSPNQESTGQESTDPRGFLHEIYHYLHHNLAHQPNLEECAADFGMSSASLKRKLQKHHSSFQQQLDLVRTHLALHWLSEAGITQEQVAQRLDFYDAANLRRAFKKWTGQLPGALGLNR